MNGREARKMLRKAGFRVTRQQGKHQVWGSGERWLSLPHNPAPELYGALAHKVVAFSAGRDIAHTRGAT